MGLFQIVLIYIPRLSIDYYCCEREGKQYISAMLEREPSRSFPTLKTEAHANANLEKTRTFDTYDLSNPSD